MSLRVFFSQSICCSSIRVPACCSSIVPSLAGPYRNPLSWYVLRSDLGTSCFRFGVHPMSSCFDGSTFQYHRISMVGVFVPPVYAVVKIQRPRSFLSDHALNGTVALADCFLFDVLVGVPSPLEDSTSSNGLVTVTCCFFGIVSKLLRDI